MKNIFLLIILIACARRIDNENLDPEVENKNDALIKAISEKGKRGKNEVIKLLEQGADPNYMGRLKMSPLMFCIHQKNKEMVKLLIEKGADINNNDEYWCNALPCACVNGTIEIMEVLLNAGADINCRDKDERTGLIWAAWYGSLDKVAFLLKKGADVNCQDNFEETALMYAASEGHIGKVKLLLEAAANVDFKNNLGETALNQVIISNICKVSSKHKKVIKLLIEKGADINNRDNKGRTSLMRVIEWKDKEIIKFLLKKGASISEKVKECKKLVKLFIHDLKENKDLLNLFLYNRKKLNINFLLFIYKFSIKSDIDLKNLLMKKMLENINISNIFTLDYFTFNERILLVDCLLYLIDLYQLIKVEKIKELKKEIIELFFEYFNSKLENNLNYKEKFINEYRVKKDNIKERSLILISHIKEAMDSFENNFTNEDLITKLEEIIN